MSRLLDLLVPHVMAFLVEVRHIVVHPLSEASRPGSSSGRMIVSALGTFGRVLRAFLALRAPAARAVEGGRRAFELRAAFA